MQRPASILRQGVAGVFSTLFSLVLWTVWLALSVLLAIQIYVASTSELAVPPFLLERVEERLRALGVRAQFTRTELDPSGRILVENVRLSLPHFPEPIVSARAIYVRFNPWMLSMGMLEPREIRVIGATISAPAMLAPSGAGEELFHGIDATVLLGHRQAGIEQLTARFGDLVITAHGTIPMRRREQPIEPGQLAALLEKRFPEFCRQAISVRQQLAPFQQPALEVELVPSAAGAPLAQLHFRARGLKLEHPLALQASGLEASTRIIQLETPTLSRIDVAAQELSLPEATSVRNFRGTVFGRLHPVHHGFEARSLELAADAVSALGFSTTAVSALVLPGPLPRAEIQVATRFLGEPLALHADANLGDGSAIVRAHGRIAPEILDLISHRLGVEIRQYFDFGAFDCGEAEVHLGPEWKFKQVAAEVSLQDINAYGVMMQSGRATVQFDGRRFYAPAAFARVGENFAHGSFEQDLRTLDYRFLLEGRLRPLAISPWFREWWPNFFRQLEFPQAPPNASVDVRGIWRQGYQSTVFVFADAASPVVRAVPLDHVRTRMFIRPSYFDGLELHAQSGRRSVRGPFTFRTHWETGAWSRFDLNFESTFPLDLIRQVMHPIAGGFFSSIQLEEPPELRVEGRFDGPGSGLGEHKRLRIRAATAGPFRFHHFPLQDVSFTAAMDDEQISIALHSSRFGGGTASGTARLSGPDAQTRLSFDVNLQNASLGQVAGALEDFFARQQNRPPSPPGKYVQEKANVRLNFTAQGEGLYANPLSYKGEGAAVLDGAEIGEVPLLGALSELFTFTALRFTSAQTSFKIDGRKLVFPHVALRGESSAIDAHGDYWLDRREFDFNARVFPFQESGNLIKSVVGAVLTPLSNALEVKLTGTLQKPQWAFVLGPTNFLRALAPEMREDDARKSPAAPADAAPGAVPPAGGDGSGAPAQPVMPGPP